MIAAPVVLQDHQRHIVLYAKGYYERTNPLHDLRKLYSHFFLLEYRFIQDLHLYQCLLDLLFLVRSAEEQHTFWGNIFHRAASHNVNVGTLIEQMVGQISICQVCNGVQTLIELGSPDSTILPLSDISTP